MAADGPGGRDELKATQRASGAGRTLAATMPRLILEARKIAATVIHGLHGRRRAGSGENFWQFRRFVSGEEARRIDWRRSARDDHLYVREQEWEAAHTVWIWPDRSPSMAFASRLARESKLDRTLVVAFALAEVLVEAGERVGLPGLMRPTGSRAVIDRMAEAIIHDPTERASLPLGFAPASLSEIVVLSDLWSPIEEIRATLDAAFGQRLAGPSGADRRSGRGDLPLFRPHRIHRARRRRRDHRRPRRELARRLRGAARAPPRRNPRRDRPARLELHHPPHRPPGQRTAAGAARAHRRGQRGGRDEPPAARHARSGGRHDGPAARLRAAAGAARPAQPAGAVVAAAAHSAAAAAHRIPADAAAVRHQAEGGHAGAHAVVADAAAARRSRRW